MTSIFGMHLAVLTRAGYVFNNDLSQLVNERGRAYRPIRLVSTYVVRSCDIGRDMHQDTRHIPALAEPLLLETCPSIFLLSSSSP